MRDAAKQVGVSVGGALLQGTLDEPEYRRVFAAMERDRRVDALIVPAEGANIHNGQLIVELAAQSRIPTMFAWRGIVDLGGLMAYAFDTAELYRRVANAIGQILNGANPGDIPYYQMTKFELVINVKTAKALGLEIPSSLLLRADEVIE